MKKATEPESDQVKVTHGDNVDAFNVGKHPVRLRFRKADIAHRFDPATETEDCVDLVLEPRR